MTEMEIDQLDVPQETKDKLKQLWLNKTITKDMILKNEGGHNMSQDKVYQKIVKQAQESYPSEHEAVAIDKVLRDNPGLYNQYLEASENSEFSQVKKDDMAHDAERILHNFAMELMREKPHLSYEQAYAQVAVDRSPEITKVTFR